MVSYQMPLRFGLKPGQTRNHLPRPPVFRLLMAESAVLVIVVTITWLITDGIAASILLGGLVFLVPQAWFTRHAFRYQGAQSAPLVVRSFYRGEAGKFVLTCTLFIAVFVLNKSLHAVSFIGAFAALSVANVILIARYTKV